MLRVICLLIIIINYYPANYYQSLTNEFNNIRVHEISAAIFFVLDLQVRNENCTIYFDTICFIIVSSLLQPLTYRYILYNNECMNEGT